MKFIALVVIAAATLWAQTPDTATLEGHVTDPSRASVAGAEIVVTNSLTGQQRTALTNNEGNFVITSLAAGTNYKLKATKEGFAASVVNNLNVGGDTAAGVNLQLSVAGQVSRVTVTGVAGEVRADTPQLGDRIAGRQLEETPMIDRRISFLPLLNSANRPAINQGDVFMNQNLFTTNGAGRRQTWFAVDGATGNDSWGRQTMFSNIPLVAVQEMTVLTNAFTAEYGGGTGSAVNIITRTGGNRLRGQILRYGVPPPPRLLFPDSRRAMPPAVMISPATRWDSRRCRWAALSAAPTGLISSWPAEYSREDKASPIISPVAPGSFVGHYRGWLGFFRLDRQLERPEQPFPARQSGRILSIPIPTALSAATVCPAWTAFSTGELIELALGEIAELTPNLLNNLRLQFQLASPITQFTPMVYGTQYQVPISTGGTFTSGTSQSALLMNRQYELSDTLSEVHGRQMLKFGADVIFAHTGGDSKEFGGPINLGEFVYIPCTASLSFCESSAYLDNIANVQTYTQSTVMRVIRLTTFFGRFSRRTTSAFGPT